MLQLRPAGVGAMYSPTRHGDSGARAAGAKVLIVEDKFLVAAQLEQQLQDAGYDVVSVAISAGEALEIAEQKNPAVAIMHIRLAGPTDGIEAAVALLSRFGIPTIFATAHADAGTRARAERACPIGWLLKPYSIDDVIKALKHFPTRARTH